MWTKSSHMAVCVPSPLYLISSPGIEFMPTARFCFCWSSISLAKWSWGIDRTCSMSAERCTLNRVLCFAHRRSTSCLFVRRPSPQVVFKATFARGILPINYQPRRKNPRAGLCQRATACDEPYSATTYPWCPLTKPLATFFHFRNIFTLMPSVATSQKKSVLSRNIVYSCILCIFIIWRRKWDRL